MHNPQKKEYLEKQFYSSKNSTNPNENQLDNQEKSLFPPAEPIGSQQNISSPQSQPYYHPSQEIATPIEQNIPINNYPTQNKNQPVLNKQYQNYNNISQIPHKGVYQPDENTFYISTGYCFRIVPIILFIIGTPLVLISFFTKELILGLLLFGLFLELISICLCFKMNNINYFILGANTLTVLKKSFCFKRAHIYNPGELLRVDFTHDYSYDIFSKANIHKYNLIVVPTNGKEDLIFAIGSNPPSFTSEEIEYFVYVINNHIQTNMRI